MKKSYLILAAVAGLLASCTSEVLVDENVNNVAEKAFTFEPFAQKVTRGTNSTKLQDFYNVFGVYGFKTIGTATASTVFENVPNEFFATDAAGTVVYTSGKPSDEWSFSANSWYYQNVRYWDKQATYQFFAIAPYEATPTYSVAAGDNNIAIATTSARYDISTEKNLALQGTTPAPAAALTYSGFNKDWMIAEKSTATSSDVQLNFHHILTKLNVAVKASDNYKSAQVLKVDEIKIVGLVKKGNFVYTTNMTTNGWSTADTYNIDIATAYALKNGTNNYSGNYWIETLIFPQTLTCKATAAQANATGLTSYLYIKYEVGSEVFEAYYDFAKVWDSTLAANGTYAFAQGSEYTLTITVGPDPIHFDANVTAWTTGAQVGLEVQ